jgi:hypothetical protein
MFDGVRFSRRGDGFFAVGQEDGHNEIFLRSVVFDETTAESLRVTSTGLIAFSQSNVRSIVISRHVGIIYSPTFKSCESLVSVSFESNCELKRVNSHAFCASSLTSITVPRAVSEIRLSCFANCEFLTSVCFDPDCELRQIPPNAFRASSVYSIVLPRNVETIGLSSFGNCKFLSSVSFECVSRLWRIEAQAFFATNIREIQLPATVVFIAGDAFPRNCDISITRIDCSQYFAEWNSYRREGSTVSFELHS